MSNTLKHPALTLADLTDETTGEIRPLKYREGMPRNYRFNASSGIVTINGEEPLTKAGDHFSLIPVAIRVFKDMLFEKGNKTWAEIFFVAQGGVMGAIMVHGFSVEGLVQLESELFYDDLQINEVILTLKPVQKTIKSGEATGEKYYIADWGYKPAPKPMLKELALMVEGVPIYRTDTAQETAEMIVALNYSVPVTATALQPGEAGTASAVTGSTDKPEEYEEKVAKEAGKVKAEK